MKSWQRTAGLFFLVLSGLVIQQSVQVLKLFDHGQPGSGLMPFGLGVILAALSLWLIAANRGADERRIPFWERRAWARPLTALAITAVYAVVFDKLGAIASVAILVACWLLFVERKRIAVALLTGALTGAVVHVLFERFLQTPFPKGVLF
jgi:multisubunit Na+/H+ antiporter MnhE subunit